MLGPRERHVRLRFLHKLVDEVALMAGAIMACHQPASAYLLLLSKAVSDAPMHDPSEQLIRLRSLRYLIEEGARIADEGGLSDIAVQLWIAHDKVIKDIGSVEALRDSPRAL